VVVVELALELADGVVEGCCRVVVVAVELVVLPWLLSAATNENRPARRSHRRSPSG